MPFKAIRPAVLSILVGFACLPLTNVEAQPLSGLTFVAKIAEYYDVVYATRPTQPAQWLFYETEPIALALAIGNRTDTEQRLAVAGRDLQQAFRVSLTQSSGRNLVPVVSVRPVAVTTQRGLRTDVPWCTSIVVPARSSVMWTADLAQLGGPGLYDLRVVPQFSGGELPIVLQAPTVRIELRGLQNLEDRIEFARRRMMRAHVTGASDAEVNAAVEELLRLHRNSAIAFRIRAERDLAAGRRQEAAANFARAIELANSGGDELLSAHTSGVERREIVGYLNGLAAKAR